MDNATTYGKDRDCAAADRMQEGEDPNDGMHAVGLMLAVMLPGAWR